MNELVKSTSEAQVKKMVGDYLTVARQQGKLLWHRLNSGMTIIQSEQERRVIKGQEKGCADFVVMIIELMEDDAFSLFRVVYIEVKRPKGGKQSDAQKVFQAEVEGLGAEYAIITSYEELERVLS